MKILSEIKLFPLCTVSHCFTASNVCESLHANNTTFYSKCGQASDLFINIIGIHSMQGHYEARSYKKKEHKKVKSYRKSV